MTWIRSTRRGWTGWPKIKRTIHDRIWAGARAFVKRAWIERSARASKTGSKTLRFSYSCKEQSALVINYDVMLLIIKPPGKKYAIFQKNSGLPKQATGKQRHSDTVKFGPMVTTLVTLRSRLSGGPLVSRFHQLCSEVKWFKPLRQW